jgi:hypothetical protein
MSRSLASGVLLPPRGGRLANDPPGDAHARVQPIALRVARLNARTRSPLLVAVHPASARREGPAHAVNTADAQAQPLVDILISSHRKRSKPG